MPQRLTSFSWCHANDFFSPFRTTYEQLCTKRERPLPQCRPLRTTAWRSTSATTKVGIFRQPPKKRKASRRMPAQRISNLCKNATHEGRQLFASRQVPHSPRLGDALHDAADADTRSLHRTQHLSRRWRDADGVRYLRAVHGLAPCARPCASPAHRLSFCAAQNRSQVSPSRHSAVWHLSMYAQ